MSNLNREFNGRIKTYSQLDTYHGHIYLSHLTNPMKYYFKKIEDFIDKKTVHIIPYYWTRGSWYEDPLVNWVIDNYKLLGYEDVVLEKTPKYYNLKKQIGFNKFPDLLVLLDNKWSRLEVECWAHRYTYFHEKGYADSVFSYDNYYHKYIPDVPTKTLKEWFGVKEIISSGEIPEFLYIYDDEFKQDYTLACTKYFARYMGISKLPR